MASILTKGQILTFFIAASCCYGNFGAAMATACQNGDPYYAENKINFMLCAKYLEIIEGYDPEAENNCLTLEEIQQTMERINAILGICSDLTTLTETETE